MLIDFLSDTNIEMYCENKGFLIIIHVQLQVFSFFLLLARGILKGRNSFDFRFLLIVTWNQ